MEEITRGNIVIISVDEKEPIMAIIPLVNFQTCTIGDIFNKINNLNKQFPTCNFKNSSFMYEDKYRLSGDNHQKLSKWFYKHNISKDEHNNYIFYIRNKLKNINNNNSIRKKTQRKKKQNKNQKIDNQKKKQNKNQKHNKTRKPKFNV